MIRFSNKAGAGRGTRPRAALPAILMLLALGTGLQAAENETAAAGATAAAPVSAPLAAAAQLGERPHAPAVISKDFLKNIGQDQKELWASPFRMKKEDAKWWLLFGGATAGLMAVDTGFMGRLPTATNEGQASTWRAVSNAGAVYALAPLSAGLYVAGALRGDAHMRETGVLATEALASSMIINQVLKAITKRQRPTEGDGGGSFGSSTGHLFNSGSSFPSGHAMTSWAVASVIAHEYKQNKYIPWLAYGGATTVSISRMLSQKHFPSDVLAGSAMGFFIGRFVYNKRHRADVEAANAAMKTALENVTATTN